MTLSVFTAVMYFAIFYSLRLFMPSIVEILVVRQTQALHNFIYNNFPINCARTIPKSCLSLNFMHSYYINHDQCVCIVYLIYYGATLYWNANLLSSVLHM